MKNNKEKELLKELFPIIIKYDLATIENCFDYISSNKDRISDCLDFVNGGQAESRKSKSETEAFLSTIDREKGLVIKRICKYLLGRNFTVEHAHSIFTQYFSAKQISTKIVSSDKEGISLEVAKFLAGRSLDEISEFERNIQMSKSTQNENTLENWSKLIVKD